MGILGTVGWLDGGRARSQCEEREVIHDHESCSSNHMRHFKWQSRENGRFMKIKVSESVPRTARSLACHSLLPVEVIMCARHVYNLLATDSLSSIELSGDDSPASVVVIHR